MLKDTPQILRTPGFVAFRSPCKFLLDAGHEERVLGSKATLALAAGSLTYALSDSITSSVHRELTLGNPTIFVLAGQV